MGDLAAVGDVAERRGYLIFMIPGRLGYRIQEQDARVGAGCSDDARSRAEGLARRV